MTTADAGPRSFELETKLGCGSVGEVWRAQVDGRMVAVKLINDPANARQRHSLETELQALNCLEHPAIPALYGFDLEGERAYIIMEYIAGEPFHRLIAEGGIWHIPLDRRLTILDQIAGAVTYSHARGLIHRDIKPANIIGIEQP
ncbi:MAG: protein kinase [Chloroflexi bacterium]|uniref:serine/threonine protein kinase n=1 Tax=Candidatus Flexifilum breve TaxID=3140694 RepID=UPI00313518C7|nr:protein kinase [Chloroflexota bacterium]